MKKSNSVRSLQEPFGIYLSKDDKFFLEQIQLKLRENKDLERAMTSTNALEKMKFKFDKVVDDLLLDFIGTKLDLYIKLMEPKINMLFKSKWFEVYRRKNAYN
jgi:type I restriction enzyme R subunit